MDRFESRREKLRSGWKAAEIDALLVSATVERQLPDRVHAATRRCCWSARSET